MAVPQLNFSPIGDLYNDFRDAQLRSRREQALQSLYPESGGDLSIANLVMRQRELQQANARDARDYALREAETKRAQANADRSFGLQERQFTAGLEGQKMPAGFERDPATGGVRPVKGGPTDPTYVQSLTEAKDKGKDFSANDITKLTEEGGKFSNLSNFATTFQDRFAGYRVPGVGNVAMQAGRYLPEGVTGKDIAEGASWWQGYDRYKNVVRNELFGSALTATEQAAFERADISPGMDPAQIRKNLETQQTILKDSMKRKAGALVAGGYKAEPIARAYGLKLEDLGVEPAKKGATVAAAGLPKVSSPAEAAKLPKGSRFIDPNGVERIVP